MTPLWASWRLKSPTNPLFVPKFVCANIKENIKDRDSDPLFRNPSKIGGFPWQRACNAEKFLYNDVTIKHIYSVPRNMQTVFVYFALFRFCYHFFKKTHALNHQTISRTLVENKIVHHPDVFGVLPVGAAPSASSFSTQYSASIDWAKTSTTWDEMHWSFRI